MNTYSQILESINIGIVIIDKDLNIIEWNSWMESYSDKSKSDVEGQNILKVYPELDRSCFIRGHKTVFTFGNLVFLSSKLHKFLFPFKLHGAYSSLFEHMQQSCYLIPIKNDMGEVEALMINIHDVTENAVLEKHLKELSYVDGLTGVYNRRTFERRLLEEFTRHKRIDSPLGLIIFDLDYFKLINDTHGHQYGDVVLQQVVKACNIKLRTEDFLARYGGEEFVCLLINQNVDQASIVAERLREGVENLDIREGKVSIKTTISLGIADSKYCNTPEELIKMADNALYQAKQNGRNRVEKAKTV